jgi:deoxyhypusine synthase
MHKYTVQITVADVRGSARSSSTLKEAGPWGKVDTSKEQMVYAEATSVLPLIAGYAYEQKDWKKRPRKEWAAVLDSGQLKIGKK